MAKVLKRHFWIFNLVLIAICALLASQALGKLVKTRLPHGETPQIAPAGTAQRSPLQAREIDQVVARNVFCSSCAPARVEQSTAGQQPRSSPDGQLSPTSLQVQLIATMLSEDDVETSLAAIKNSSGTSFYGVGEKLQGTTILSISERRIVLLNGSRLESLDLLRAMGAARRTTVAHKPGNRLPRPRPGLERIARGIRKLGAGKYEIRKEALGLVLSRPTMMARGGQVIPVVRGGKPSGIMLRRVRRGSVYSLLGLFSGDTITAINGRALTSPEVALQLYTKLRNATHLSVAFQRRGKQLSHDYTIR